MKLNDATPFLNLGFCGHAWRSLDGHYDHVHVDYVYIGSYLVFALWKGRAV